MDTIKQSIALLVGWSYTQDAFFDDFTDAGHVSIGVLRSNKEITVDGQIRLRGPYVGSKIVKQLYDMTGILLLYDYHYVDEIPEIAEFCKSVADDEAMQNAIRAAIVTFKSMEIKGDIEK